jgi:cytochrome P450
MPDQDNRNPTAPGYGGDASSLDDLFDMSAPQRRYVSLIEQAPAMSTMDGMVMVNSRAAVDEALRDPSRFSSAYGGGIVLGNTRPLIPLSVDPPDHSKYRKILDPLFAPRRMDAIEDDVAARVNHFVDEFADRGSCHFTNEFATPFPSAVFLGLMGLPWEELDTFLRMKNGIIRPGADNPDPHERMRIMLDQEERLRIQHETGQDIYRYFDAILDERAAAPKDDILSHFLSAEVDGDSLTREEILDICFLFLIAGLDTVTDSLTCFFAYLAQHPEHRRQIVDDPTVIPSAVEELLRWETPVPGVPRFCTQDSEIAGCPVKQGDALLVQVGAANVDPAVFPDGFDVRFDREANPHIAFGGGVHRCLGSHLARRELRVALREWHRRIPDYELKPGIHLEYASGLRTVENLELVW